MRAFSLGSRVSLNTIAYRYCIHLRIPHAPWPSLVRRNEQRGRPETVRSKPPEAQHTSMVPFDGHNSDHIRWQLSFALILVQASDRGRGSMEFRRSDSAEALASHKRTPGELFFSGRLCTVCSFAPSKNPTSTFRTSKESSPNLCSIRKP
jgi:hypothetical protein